MQKEEMSFSFVFPSRISSKKGKNQRQCFKKREEKKRIRTAEFFGWPYGSLRSKDLITLFVRVRDNFASAQADPTIRPAIVRLRSDEHWLRAAAASGP